MVEDNKVKWGLFPMSVSTRNLKPTSASDADTTQVVTSKPSTVSPMSALVSATKSNSDAEDRSNFGHEAPSNAEKGVKLMTSPTVRLSQGGAPASSEGGVP